MKEQRKKPLRHGLGIMLVMLTLLACWSATYYVSNWLYLRLNIQPIPLAQQLISSLVGFIIFGCIMASFGRLLSPRRKRSFQLFIDAIRRMAKGDFQVNLDVQMQHNHPLNELAHSINQMARNLEQMEQMRQEFISNVSHEIQSPLTSISGFARALQGEELSAEERAHYLTIIETESIRLSKLSDNLLKLTSLESEHHPFEPRPYRLDKQLRHLLLACEPQWVEKELILDVSLAEVTIEADEDLLSQVWTNLLNNSIKFTPKGGQLAISLTQDGDDASITISDSGIGISEQDLEHIFERFFKADKSRNRLGGGSGLGLSIVKKIVDMHHGKITVASQPHEYTTFTVTLPFMQPSEKTNAVS